MISYSPDCPQISFLKFLYEGPFIMFTLLLALEKPDQDIAWHILDQWQLPWYELFQVNSFWVEHYLKALKM